ncbi:MAG TPA: type II secretion system F family protein, partial [Planctomycetota bacterium]|nr:type II secretion system F family protein [Planctomycetota bacterium]
MPVYSYKALNAEGSSEAGVIDADTPRDARTKLKSRRLHVTALESVATAEKAARVRVPWAGRKSRAELPMITRQLGTLLSSGIPLMGTLNAVIEQAEERRLKAVLLDVRERVAQGVAFSDALGAHPRLFSELYVNMVRAGEASGALDKILFRLADYLHAARRLNSKIVAALTYPFIMLIVGGVVVVLLMALVVPQITTVLLKQKKVLPLPTEILMAVSGAIRGYWWVGLIGIAAGWVALVKIRATKAGRLWMDTALLKIPVLGPLLRKSAVSRFALTFATLLESGLPVLECVAVVKRVVNNQLMANVLEDDQRKIAEGADIATPMKQSKVFPPVVGYMIAVGEESGRLEELLKRISQAYDEEIEIAAQRLTSLLEPIMIVVMSLIVGFIVL